MQARYYDPVIGRFYSNDPGGAVQHLGSETSLIGQIFLKAKKPLVILYMIADI